MQIFTHMHKYSKVGHIIIYLGTEKDSEDDQNALWA
jgi:hypothetical protein